jgi:hypothetical protein
MQQVLVTDVAYQAIDFTYSPSIAARNITAQHVEGPASLHDVGESSPEHDLHDLNRTATTGVFDSAGLVVVNTDENFDATGLMTVDVTTRNLSPSDDADMSQLNNAEAMAALGVDRNATVHILDGLRMGKRL